MLAHFRIATNIWPLHTGLGGVTGWMLLQQLARVEEAFNLNANLLGSDRFNGSDGFPLVLRHKSTGIYVSWKALHQQLSFVIAISAKMVSLSARILNFFSGNLKSKK